MIYEMKNPPPPEGPLTYYTACDTYFDEDFFNLIELVEFLQKAEGKDLTWYREKISVQYQKEEVVLIFLWAGNEEFARKKIEDRIKVEKAKKIGEHGWLSSP